MKKRVIAACAAILVLAPAYAYADESSWTLSYTHENDLFDEGHDRNYTVGQLLSLTSPPQSTDDQFLYRLSRLITPIEDDVREARVEFSLAHEMFTPEDLTLVNPDPNDRPYAGLMIGSVTLIASTTNAKAARSQFDTVTYSIGVIGPQSHADDLQTWFHEEIDGIEPRGWGRQIPNRVVGGISYQNTYRLVNLADNDLFQADLYQHLGFSLGTIQTSASAGLSVRVGQDPPQDYGLPRLSPAIRGGSFFTGTSDWGWYAFAGVEQRYIAYDVTLDEAPAGGVVTVDRRDWVTDAQVGAAVYWRWLRVGYSHVWRTETYRSQREPDAFGAVSVSTHLWF